MEREREYTAKHGFLVFGLGVIVFGPIFLFFMPEVLVHYRFLTNPDVLIWDVYILPAAYAIYGISFIILSIGAFIIAKMDINKKSLIIGSICFALSALIFVKALETKIIFSNDGIVYQSPYSVVNKEYSWDELEAVNIYSGIQKFVGYELILKDGTVIRMNNTSISSTLRGTLLDKISDLGIEIETIF